MPEMASALRHLEACGADCIIMPCNTAHYFLPRLQAMDGDPVPQHPHCGSRSLQGAVSPEKNRGNSGYPRHAGGQSLSGGAGAGRCAVSGSRCAGAGRPDACVIYDGVEGWKKAPDSYRATFLTGSGANVLPAGAGEGISSSAAQERAAGGGSPDHRPAHVRVRTCGDWPRRQSASAGYGLVVRGEMKLFNLF